MHMNMAVLLLHALLVPCRRPGDSVAVWAATELAEEELGWKTK